MASGMTVELGKNPEAPVIGPVAHTLPCLSKRRDLCSMIDFIKKKKTLLSSHALLLKPNCQILSNLAKIIKSLNLDS